VSITTGDVPGGSAFPHLFSPFSIGGVALRNRTVFQPHFTALGSLEGMPTNDLAAYHEERARGGVGLIITESQAIHPSGKMSARFLDAWDPAIIPGLAKVAAGVHAHGAKIFAQLTHGGHTSLERPPHIMWAPTQMPEPSSHFSTKALDEDDIRAVISGFAASARNNLDAGFDGIEIKIAHDGLLRSFASPFFNHRTDRYGGSFENRMRLSFEVIEAIKKIIDAVTPLGVRICLDEFTAFGYDLEYGLQMVRALEATGLVDYFNADAGSFSSYWMEIPPAAVAPEAFDRLNRALKKATKLPVVAFGRITPPQRAEALLKAGDADLIGWARQLIADPQTPNKLAKGRPDLVRPCIACNDGCIYQVGQEKGVRCIHNPGAGRELKINERLVSKAEAARKIVVIGGGPAGLKVAESRLSEGIRSRCLSASAGWAVRSCLRPCSRNTPWSAKLFPTSKHSSLKRKSTSAWASPRRLPTWRRCVPTSSSSPMARSQTFPAAPTTAGSKRGGWDARFSLGSTAWNSGLSSPPTKCCRAWSNLPARFLSLTKPDTGRRREPPNSSPIAAARSK